jgi:hypothetical protein
MGDSMTRRLVVCSDDTWNTPETSTVQIDPWASCTIEYVGRSAPSAIQIG